MEEAVNYYLERVNSEKKTGYMFGFIPFPSGSPMAFTIMNIMIFALIGVCFSIPLLLFPVLFIIVWEHYLVSHKRNILFDECMATEAYYQQEFITKGVDPNFPQDPLYITKGDRREIFDEHAELFKNPGFFNKLKIHQAFILLLVAFYIVAYYILKYLINTF